MRVGAVRVRTVEVADDDPLAGTPERQAKTRPIVTVRVRTDCGIEGIGIAFTFGGMTNALASAAQELADLTIGEDAACIEQIASKLRLHAATLSDCGIFLTALSAIDCALWDIRGKQAGEPLWKLLGGLRRRVPSYASGQLHRGVADANLADAAGRVVARGFRHLKLHVGRDGAASPAAELQRARLVREAIGPDVALLCDANERWSVGQAIDMGRRLEEVGLYWLEDPTPGHDYDGLARIARALSTPVIAGENAWGVTPFRLMLEARSTDILMIDIMHVGGVTGWMKIAAMAEAFNVPVVSHIMPEFQVHLMAAIPNALLAECKTWTWRLFDGLPELADGDFVLSDRPGHGLSFSREFASLT